MSAQLPEHLYHPHVLTNEDGVRLDHPGYLYRKCKRCGREYLSGREPNVVNMDFCGYPDCNKGLVA